MLVQDVHVSDREQIKNEDVEMMAARDRLSPGAAHCPMV